MSIAKRRYSKQEIADRGDALFDSAIRPGLDAADEGRFAAIDVDSGQFAIDDSELAACDRLRERAADAQIWSVQIGSPYLHRFVMLKE